MRYYGLTIALSFILVSCSSQEDVQPPPPAGVPVIAVEAKVKDVPLYLESMGTIQPLSSVDIRPQVNGLLQKVHFTEGQKVSAGDLLFDIDEKSYQHQLQEAQAQLAQDKAIAAMLQKKLERYNSLSQKDLIPQQEWDELHFQLEKQNAQILNDEAKVSASQLNLQNCHIVAPISGHIGRAAYGTGSLVSAFQADPLATVVDIQNLIVEFTLTEKEYQQLIEAKGSEPFICEVFSFTDDQHTTKGKITYLDNTFDEQTGTLLLQGQLLNETRRHLPGQHVQVRVPISIRKGALIIPQVAVKIDQEGPYVFVAKQDNTVELRHVQLGDEFEEDVIIAEGILPGEKIITEGHLRLAPGKAIRIQDEQDKKQDGQDKTEKR